MFYYKRIRLVRHDTLIMTSILFHTVSLNSLDSLKRLPHVSVYIDTLARGCEHMNEEGREKKLNRRRGQ